MEKDAPSELRFDFALDESETAKPKGVRSGTGGKEAVNESGDAQIAELRPRTDGGTEAEDHAAELKRRVAELRTASRRSKAGRRVVPDKETANDLSEIASPSVRSGGLDPFPDEKSPPIGERLVELLEDPFDNDETTDEALTIAAFYERVRRALQNEFTEEIWVSGEIRGFRESRGHRYLEMADKGVEVVGRGVAQQLEVVCWARDWPPIARALAEVGVDLEVGRVVRVRGKVSVWEGGSKLRFTLTALDVEALVGGIAAARRRLLAVLAEEDLLEANRRLVLPLVPLRIGIVTSPGSEAHRDFVGQLERSGFAFDVHLEPSLVQGAEAPRQIASALEQMASFGPELVVLIRGGGARGDLAAFDDELVARAIATAPFPIWTGIGHTSDRSVADEVAHRALITPTACGEAVVEIVDSYWGDAVRRMEIASRLAANHLDAAERHVRASASSLVQCVRHQLGRRADGLLVAHRGVARAARTQIDLEASKNKRRANSLKVAGDRATGLAEHDLERHRQVLNAFDPARQLERGWSLVHDQNGHVVRSIEDLAKGDQLRTHLLGGHVNSVVESIDRETTKDKTTND